MENAKQKLRIVADRHEQRSGIPDLLTELGVSVEVTSLPAGDYAVSSDTIVERKRVLDLHSAIIKGRLWPQIGKLRAACAFPYLLVEGTDIDRGPLHPNSIRGACLAVIDVGIPLLRSDHQRDSALWLHRLATRSQRAEVPPEKPAYAQRPKYAAGSATAEAVLAAVPGLSTVSARALLARFGRIAGVVSAKQEEWMEVPGIGQQRAQMLADTLSLQWNPPP